MVSGKVVALGVAVVLALAGVVVFLVVSSSPSGPSEPAKPFAVFTVDGQTITVGGPRDKVLLVDFSGIVCDPCRLAEVALRELHPVYSDRVEFLSVFIGWGGGGADNASILSFRSSEAAAGRPIPWHLATAALTMQTDYGVVTIPDMFVIDQRGFVVHEWKGAVGVHPTEGVRSDLPPALERAIAGNATPINVTSLSIPALLVVAAFLSFFSPCSFPVLPAFMTYYLKEDAKGAKASNAVAAGRGFLASLGIVAVYGLIAIIIAAAGFAAQAIVKWLPPIIGVVLIVLAVLTLLPFQYHFLTRPFIALKQKLVARFGGKWTPGLGAKLFSFGVGYGAAGFACVAPPFIGAVLNASALGSMDQAIVGLVLYVSIVISLMVTITVALHIAGDRALRRVKAWAGAMKYVSAVALIIAGLYLIWLFLAAYVFSG
jgi:cytochrome c-type biogenesis protein